MIVLLILGIVAVFLSLPMFNQNNRGLQVAFFLIIIVSAIRKDYGNDYWPYYDMFEYIKNSTASVAEIIKTEVFDRDFGWLYACRFFAPLGFHTLLAVIAVFTNLVYYRFIVENVQPEYYPFAMFIFIFDPNFFVLGLSMIRQWVTQAMFVWSLHYAKKKQFLVPIILALIALTIHKSAALVFPFLLIFFIPSEKIKYAGVVVLFLFLMLLFSRELLQNIFSFFSGMEQFEEYDRYSEADDQFGIRNALRVLPVGIACIVLFKRDWERDRFSAPLWVLLSLGILIFPFRSIVFMVYRIGFYFNVLSVAVYPQIYSALKEHFVRMVMLGTIFLMIIVDYYRFFTSEIYGNSYSIFYTIFDGYL